MHTLLHGLGVQYSLLESERTSMQLYFVSWFCAIESQKSVEPESLLAETRSNIFWKFRGEKKKFIGSSYVPRPKFYEASMHNTNCDLKSSFYFGKVSDSGLNTFNLCVVFLELSQALLFT